jgi:hypothetical protein
MHFLGSPILVLVNPDVASPISAVFPFYHRMECVWVCQVLTTVYRFGGKHEFTE